MEAHGGAGSSYLFCTKPSMTLRYDMSKEMNYRVSGQKHIKICSVCKILQNHNVSCELGHYHTHSCEAPVTPSTNVIYARRLDVYVEMTHSCFLTKHKISFPNISKISIAHLYHVHFPTHRRIWYCFKIIRMLSPPTMHSLIL